jgi:hypothetical protein
MRRGRRYRNEGRRPERDDIPTCARPTAGSRSPERRSRSISPQYGDSRQHVVAIDQVAAIEPSYHTIVDDGPLGYEARVKARRLSVDFHAGGVEVEPPAGNREPRLETTLFRAEHHPIPTHRVAISRPEPESLLLASNEPQHFRREWQVRLGVDSDRCDDMRRRDDGSAVSGTVSDAPDDRRGPLRLAIRADRNCDGRNAKLFQARRASVRAAVTSSVLPLRS